MSLTQDQIKHIAQLSRLELSSDQVELYRRDLEAIVEYMDILKNVPDADLAKVTLSDALILPLREDISASSPISRESLLSVSEQKKIAGAIALPNIMQG
jgi:aspartyl-tRNA(Asn)/glutamyl-tRNA(Gln) amidotransferase subunit C